MLLQLLEAAESAPAKLTMGLLVQYGIGTAVFVLLLVIYLRLKKRDAIPSVKELGERLKKESEELNKLDVGLESMRAIAVTRSLTNREYNLSELTVLLLRASEDRRDLRYEDASKAVAVARDKLDLLNADLKLTKEGLQLGIKEAKAQVVSAMEILKVISEWPA